MGTASHVTDVLRSVLAQRPRGVVRLVDDLLTMCQEYGLQLEWRPDCCRVRPAGGEWEELADVALRKSVFRAILARIATLCNEQNPNSVSPYGGEGQIVVGADPAHVVHVAFANTPAEQRLELATGKE